MSKNYDKKFVRIDINGIKIERDKSYLFVMSDGKEVWFPKSQCRNLQNNSCEITEYILSQKGYDYMNPPMTDEQGKKLFPEYYKGKCVNCGGEVGKKGFKYCLECYNKIKSGEIVTGSERIDQETARGEYLAKVESEQINAYQSKLISIKGFCANCGHQTGIASKDGKVFCERCHIKVSDGLDEWINVKWKCEKCNDGIYEPFGYFVLKCSRCNYMVGINPIKQQGGRSI